MSLFRSLLRIWRPASWQALYRDCTHWRSPFRIIRWYALRAVHPFAYLKRRRLVPTLTPEQQKRLALMQQKGFGPAQQDLDPKLLSELTATLRNMARDIHIDPNGDPTKKNFWQLILKDQSLDTTNPFVRFVLQPDVLKMASGYFGEVPYVAYIHVALSHPTNNESWKASQLWHEDYDDRKILKLFVYCTDVNDEEDGPFTYIPRDASMHVKNSFFPGRIDDAAMGKYVKSSDYHSVKGPKNTAFYIDTRNCYHLGSRIAPGHTRLAFMASFVSFASLQPFSNGIKVISPLNEIERLVLQK